MKRIGVAAIVLVVAAYPFLLVESLDHLSARSIGGSLLAIVALVTLSVRGRASRLLPLLLRRFGLVLVVAGAAAATNEPATLKLLPSLTSAFLLVTFAASLRREPSLVGQFAIAMHDGFPDFLLPYCRKVTWMWCVVFAANAVVSTVLAVAAPDRIWALYTGVVSYLLIAALGLGEYVFHKARFRFYENGWADRLWRRVLPAERTALGRRTLEWQVVHQPGVYRTPRPGDPGRRGAPPAEQR